MSSTEPKKKSFEDKLREANDALDSLDNTLPQEQDENTNLQFKEYWDSLKPNLDFFDYEQELEQILKENKYLWIKKATGLGISEFFLRWIAYQCKFEKLREKQIDVSVVIITGPRIELAVQLIDRLKAIQKPDYETKETVCIINGCKIEAFPSHHLASARGLNPFLVFLDEADFFPPKEQQEARSVSERYIAKTDPHIIMVSTPYLPGGLYEQIEKEENSLYKKIKWNYEVGLNKIYTAEQIEKARQSPAFEREYNLQYGIGIGNIFQFIDECLEVYDQKLANGQKILTVDPAYGSSKFGIMGFEKINGRVYVKDAVQFERPSPTYMVEVIIEKAHLFGNRVLVDSAHPGLIKDLRERGIECTPVVFGEKIDPKNTLLSKMTINAAQMVKEKRVIIHPNYTELIQQLKSAQFNDKGHPDKTILTFDLGDCFLMGCYYLKEVELRMIKV